MRKACVRRSIASATTAGDGGKGTLDANASADARGVRVRAVRARVVAGSTSESSLEGVSFVMIPNDAQDRRVTYVGRNSSAAFVTLRLTCLALVSTSDRADEASFFTGEVSPPPRLDL